MPIFRTIEKGSIKSVQRGVIDFTNISTFTQAISPVNTDKSVLHVAGTGQIQRNSDNELTTRTYRITFVGDSQINVTSSNFGLTGSTGTISGTASWQVVEYY
jgi:hypothetical protein